MEKEEQSRKRSFLDVTFINTGTEKYEFKIHKKKKCNHKSPNKPTFIRSLDQLSTKKIA